MTMPGAGLRNDVDRAVAVLHACRRQGDREQQSERVDDEMALARP
jgi:hypothetical protein